MHRLRHHLSYANVVSTLCLFIVLGGTAWAAVAAKSVGTAQLKNGAVTKQKIAGGAVTDAKIADRTFARAALGGSLRTAVKGRCPLGSRGTRMDKVGAGGGFCMDHFARGPARYFGALNGCGKARLLLPSVTEAWLAAYAGRLAEGEGYWVDFSYRDSANKDWAQSVNSGTAYGPVVEQENLETQGAHYYFCVTSPMYG
jgi:hypothetical protein